MKLPTEQSYTLEVRLMALQSFFDSQSKDGVTLTPQDVMTLCGELEMITKEFAHMRSELSSKRWTDRARFDDLLNEVIKQAFDGNVEIFPVQPKPIPINAIQHGRQS